MGEITVDTPILSFDFIQSFFDWKSMNPESLIILLGNTGIELTQLGSFGPQISYRQLAQLIHNILFVLDCPEDLFSGVSELSFSEFGMFGFALLSSPNAGKALELSSRFMQLNAPFLEASSVRTSDKDVLTINETMTSSLVGSYFVELVFCLSGNFLNKIANINDGVYFLCKYKKPPYFDRIKEYLPFPIYYDANVNQSVTDSFLYDKEIPLNDPYALKIAEDACEQQLKLLGVHQSPLLNSLRSILVRNPANLPSFFDVAKELHLSERTLSRKLGDQKTSYKEIKIDIKRSLACELLKEGLLSTEEIAEKVGYTETTNFSRAFKRWTGYTPSGYRKSLC